MTKVFRKLTHFVHFVLKLIQSCLQRRTVGNEIARTLTRV